MKQKFSKTFRTLSIITFALGLITIGMAYGIRYAKSPYPAIGFKMTSTQTFTPSGSEPILRASVERFQKADGAFKLTHTYYNPDGSVRRTSSGFAQIGRGVFRVDENDKTLNYVSPKSEQRPVITEDGLRKDPHFVREETVLGYKTFVVRIPDDDNSGYTELYQAIALQGLAIKMVSVSDAGISVLEPTSIEEGEPDASIFENVPDYPVSYKEYEQKMQPRQQK